MELAVQKESMMEHITVYMPYDEEEVKETRVSPRLDTLEGKTIGLLNNGWRSLQITYQEFSKLLREKFRVADVIEKCKPYPSRPLPEQVLKELAKQVDAVIVGIGH